MPQLSMLPLEETVSADQAVGSILLTMALCIPHQDNPLQSLPHVVR